MPTAEQLEELAGLVLRLESLAGATVAPTAIVSGKDTAEQQLDEMRDLIMRLEAAVPPKH